MTVPSGAGAPIDVGDIGAVAGCEAGPYAKGLTAGGPGGAGGLRTVRGSTDGESNAEGYDVTLPGAGDVTMLGADDVTGLGAGDVRVSLAPTTSIVAIGSASGNGGTAGMGGRCSSSSESRGSHIGRCPFVFALELVILVTSQAGERKAWVRVF